MDRSLFSDKSTGEVVRLDRPFPDFAFIPHDVPPNWEFDASLWALLGDAREALGELNGIGQTLPDPELLLRPLQNRESISSSSIEGTFVTPEQLLLYEMDPKEPVSATEKRADWMEVFSYSRALRTGCELLADSKFSNHVIRSIHATLMQGVRGRDKSPGEFRNGQVQIGSNARFVPPPPVEVPRLMDNLIEYINSDDETNPLVKAFIAHYQFEAIHPFKDGNGRVGRAMMSIMIYKWHNHSHPWLYLSPFFEKYKDEYVQAMFQISTSGKWSTWIELCLRGVISQAKDAIERCRRFRVLREQYLRRMDNHSARTHGLIESLFREPIISITGVSKRLGISYHTAQGDIDKLVSCGILTELPDSRPKAFYPKEIMQIAYSDDI